MNVSTITMDPEEAREKLRAYRKHLHSDAEFEAAVRGYSALARGAKLLHLGQTFHGCPVDEKGRPKLAIARADRKQVAVRIMERSAEAAFDARGGWGARESGIAADHGHAREGYAEVPPGVHVVDGDPRLLARADDPGGRPPGAHGSEGALHPVGSRAVGLRSVSACGPIATRSCFATSAASSTRSSQSGISRSSSARSSRRHGAMPECITCSTCGGSAPRPLKPEETREHFVTAIVDAAKDYFSGDPRRLGGSLTRMRTALEELQRLEGKGT